MFSKIVFGALLVLLAAYYYQNYISNGLDEVELEKKYIVEAWQELVKVPEPNFHRICVGTNANVDLIVRGTRLLTALGIKPGKDQYRDELESLEHLQETFHHFFKNGAAAERQFLSGEAFKQVTHAAAGLKTAEWYIGGNAALMAEKIATSYPSIEVQLVGPVGPRLASLLDERVHVAQRATEDEVHLIMEYNAGEEWGDSKAPVATRFITSHDIANGEMRPLAQLFQSIDTFKPDLLIFSGLHLFDGKAEEFYEQKLEEVVAHLKKVDPKLPVHLELASMAKVGLVKAIVEKVLSHVTSLGLNEQELSFISHIMDGPHSDVFDSGKQPEVHQVGDMLLWLLSSYGAHTHPDSRLSRIHFHSLTFHMLAVLPERWSDPSVAVAMGAQVAGLQACDHPHALRLPDVDLRFPAQFRPYSSAAPEVLDARRPVLRYRTAAGGSVDLALSPVLVCRAPAKTVGLGDAISATGLIHSQYIPPS